MWPILVLHVDIIVEKQLKNSMSWKIYYFAKSKYIHVVLLRIEPFYKDYITSNTRHLEEAEQSEGLRSGSLYSIFGVIFIP